MVKKLGTKKHKSNRLTMRQKKKQMKKTVMHNAMARKAMKIGKLMGTSKLSKDPGIPNLWPFKEKLLRKAERERERAEEEAEQKKQQKVVERAKRKKDISSTGQVDEMAALAAERARIYEARQAKALKIAEKASWSGGSQGNRDAASARKTRRQYFTMLQQLVKKADIVIEVLDARDPAGCRAPVRACVRVARIFLFLFAFVSFFCLCCALHPLRLRPSTFAQLHTPHDARAPARPHARRHAFARS
jgi:nuclear GTP-binding protein